MSQSIKLFPFSAFFHGLILVMVNTIVIAVRIITKIEGVDIFLKKEMLLI
jgi:hypothetical protein